MSAHSSKVRTHCNEWARFSDSLMLRALAAVSVGLVGTSRLDLSMVNFALKFVICLIETRNICCSEYGSRCNELARVGKP